MTEELAGADWRGAPASVYISLVRIKSSDGRLSGFIVGSVKNDKTLLGSWLEAKNMVR